MMKAAIDRGCDRIGERKAAWRTGLSRNRDSGTKRAGEDEGAAKTA